jgi:ribonuclease P protein component
MRRGQGLARPERVRRRPEFERAYDNGVRIHGRFMTVFVTPNGGESPRFGVAATRKLGPAVERNRAKRLAREVFRRNKVEAGVDIIVVPRREMLDAPFATVEADYVTLLARRDRVRPSAPRERRSRHGRGSGAAARV